MPRDASIPLFLWIATAMLIHLLWGGGADQVGRVLEERADVGRFAASVQRQVKSSISPPVEVTIEESPPEPEPPEAEPKEAEPDPQASTQPKPESEPTPDSPEPEKTPPKEEETAPEAKEPEPVKDEPEEQPKAEPKKEEPIKVQELELPKRIAVKQFADPNQEDNPDAKYIAEHANKVEQETQASVTSNVENAPDPTPGSNPTGPSDDIGNAAETRVAHDRDAPGENRAPDGEASEERIARVEQPRVTPPPAAGSPPQAREPSQRAQEPQQGQQASQAQAGMPETMSSEEGGFSVAPPRTASKAQEAKPTRKALPKPKARRPEDMLGFGAAGVTPNGVNLNVSPSIAAASIGMDELSRLRRADGERRRSAHRGKFRTSGIERWRAAIENYVASVKPGNQTALNTARAPFASYLNSIHNRLHPIFADQFLASLESLPGNHPMNKPDISTNLEIVLDQEEGRIVKMGVTKTSGVTAFDIAALDSVSRAAPFGTPPAEIVSPDGNVYLHWEFHRNMMACSTLNARPYMLKVQPKSAPPPKPEPPALPPPLRPSEPGPGTDERHGSLERPNESVF